MVRARISAYIWDGKLLAVAQPARIYFYNSATLRETRYTDTRAPVGQLAFSADGKFLAAMENGKRPDLNNTPGSVTGNQVDLYDVASGQELRSYRADGSGGKISTRSTRDINYGHLRRPRWGGTNAAFGRRIS